MKKILVTGGAGFIGSHIVKKYFLSGFEVAVLDDFSSGDVNFLPKNFPEKNIYQGDVANGSFVQDVFQKFRPNIVSHHAGHVSVRNSIADPIFDAEKNIQGSINIFKSAGEVGSVEHVIFASTGGLIDQACPQFPSVETEVPTITMPYAIAKFSAERYLQYFSKKHGFIFTVFRYANIYGPHQTPKSEAGVISIFIEHLLQKKPITIFGDGNQTRDFLYIDDLSEAHFITTKQKISGLFHLGTGSETSINKLYKILCQKIVNKNELQYKDLADGELLRSSLSAEKFQKVSGWSPKIKLEEGLEEAIEWRKNFVVE